VIRLMVRILFAFLVSTNSNLAAQTFSYPGGISQFIISKESNDIPEVKFGLQEPVIMEYPTYWRILIGLSLDTLPGDYVAYIKSGIEGASGQYQKVIVKQHIYPFKEYSEIDETISKHAVIKIHKSLSELDFSNTQQPSLPLRWPLEGSWSNNFGHKLYDRNRESLHIPNAIVISTKKISTVVAPQAAIVSKIDTDDSGTSTVFLDHGRGLYSILSGLSDITVELGNGIVSGAVIGKLTGDNKQVDLDSPNSGTRLVWQTVVNKNYVNPTLLTQLKP